MKRDEASYKLLRTKGKLYEMIRVCVFKGGGGGRG